LEFFKVSIFGIVVTLKPKEIQIKKNNNHDKPPNLKGFTEIMENLTGQFVLFDKKMKFNFN